MKSLGKFRIYCEDGWYYPQERKFFFWFNFYEYLMYDNRYVVSFCRLEKAKEWLDKELAERVARANSKALAKLAKKQAKVIPYP